MGDLISRSDVTDVIDELEVYTSGRPNTMKVEISVLQLQRFINKLKNIPPAHNVDKVVEQLNNIKKYNLDLADTMLDIQANGINRHFVCLEDVIEIVKAGGNVNE